MSKLIDRFRIKPGAKVDLSSIDPAFTGKLKSKQEADDRLEKNIARLNKLQYRLAAENRRALLIILQAMDAGGKDGTIRHVMTGLNPQGCRVTPFKVPAGEETRHDFLWRIHRAVPGFGEIGIFNRSQYEDVLVVRIHDLVPKAVWSARYDQINDFEKTLSGNRMRILKFFLHISSEEQKARLEARVNDPEKRWKISEADLAERKYWNDYMRAYEDVLRKCSTKDAPWFVIPSNHKWFRNLAVSEIIADTLEDMNPTAPKASIDLSKVSFK